MFAIVDIETTGGHAASNGITEIAIVLHNGKEIEGKYSTLVNPNTSIPPYVQSLTGITNAMVAAAPQFNTVAAYIFNLLKDRVFVAHNVNFDYSFVKHHLQEAGYNLNTPKLCTIRSARKIFPGYTKYGLGSICRELDIEINDRHRAEGDAIATTKLFELLLANDGSGEIKGMVKGKSAAQYLPPNLSIDVVSELPQLPGVYYFHNKAGKVVYVGKAKDIKQRVTSHFSNNKVTKQKQDFLRDIYNITFKVCGTELMAAILESIEIRRLWPAYNQSQKKAEQVFGLYTFEDARGYWRLVIEHKRKHLEPIHSFSSLLEGRQLLKSLIDRFELCAKLCFIDVSVGATLVDLKGELPSVYNKRVNAAIAYMESQLPSFVIREDDVSGEEQSCILVEKGRFAGMGKVPKEIEFLNTSDVKSHVEILPENTFIRNLIYQYADKFPERKSDVERIVA
ncbi:MAG: exonuclease domain-containing protein [Chitinophagaceae bacterium]|jgi:DNA polymerase-3 subunit epsilon|nr:GIY-YIG nuclease family protein [Chitinophagaceae bacterium]